jgi:hypothetical protein
LYAQASRLCRSSLITEELDFRGAPAFSRVIAQPFILAIPSLSEVEVEECLYGL